MATEFLAELEGLDAVALTTANSGFSSKSGAWEFDTAFKATLTSSAMLVNSAGSTGALQWNHPGLGSVRYYDFAFRLAALPLSELMVAQLRSGATNRAQVTVQTDGTLRIKNNTTAADSAAILVSAGDWVRVQWGVNGSTQTARVWISSNPANLFNQSAMDTLSGSYTQGTWDQFRLGVMNSIDATMHVDRVIVDDSTWPTEVVTANQTPTANAGPDQSVAASAFVTLDGTSSTDPDGTISSYAWTQVGGQVVTLSSASVAQPTFTAPSLASVLTFELRVTDNAAAQSAADTVTITVSDPPSTPAEDYVELFEGGTLGAAVNTSNTTLDFADPGFVFVAGLGEGNLAAQVVGGGTSVVLSHYLAGPADEAWLDAVFKIADLSNGPYYICRALDGTGTLRASIRVDADGGIRLRNGIIATGTATTAKAQSGQPFRVAWHIDNTGTTQEARLFTGSNLWGTTPDAGGTTTGTYNTGTFQRLGIGIASPAVAGTVTVDSLRIDGQDWPLPVTGGITVTSSEIFQLGPVGEFIPMALDIL